MKKSKEPSLFRKLVEIHWEQAKQNREIRRLTKQSWSFDFLCAMLVKAGKILGDGVQLEISDRDGKTIRLTYQEAKQSDSLKDFDNNIFNQLDDQAAVARFIRTHSVR